MYQEKVGMREKGGKCHRDGGIQMSEWHATRIKLLRPAQNCSRPRPYAPYNSGLAGGNCHNNKNNERCILDYKTGSNRVCTHLLG